MNAETKKQLDSLNEILATFLKVQAGVAAFSAADDQWVVHFNDDAAQEMRVDHAQMVGMIGERVYVADQHMARRVSNSLNKKFLDGKNRTTYAPWAIWQTKRLQWLAKTIGEFATKRDELLAQNPVNLTANERKALKAIIASEYQQGDARDDVVDHDVWTRYVNPFKNKRTQGGVYASLSTKGLIKIGGDYEMGSGHGTMGTVSITAAGWDAFHAGEIK
jgi:hypothetical protein